MQYLPLPMAKWVDVNDFDPVIFRQFSVIKRRKNKNRSVEKFDILDCITAFDIETTNLDDIQQAVMYVWQFQIDEELTVFGRTWDEFLLFLQKIIPALPEKTTLVCFIHNASFEFSFLKGVYNFAIDEVFATERRKVLYFTMFERRFEFRCSYRLSNMNLRDFTRKFHVKHEKLNDFDYGLQRFWFSPLTVEEMRYCQNDVLGLVEAVRALMISEKCNLMNMPLTSTGFIRKELKQIVFENIGYRYAQPYFPDPELYKIMRLAFRGGDTHCNRFYVNDILYGISSADRSSSYPDVLCNSDQFPVEPFVKVEQEIDRAYLEKLIYVRDRAILMEVTLRNVQLKNPFWGSPYISKDKSYNIIGGKVYNGRILSATSLTCALTDIDYMIINETYNFEIDVLKWWKAPKGKIPQCIIDFIIKQYKLKTELKGLAGEFNETLYNKSKNRLNGIYGLFATAPIRIQIEYLDADKDFHYDEHTSEAEVFAKCKRGYWLPYQFGIYTTALARMELFKMVKLASAGQNRLDLPNGESGFSDYVYSDTDSVKYIGNVDFSAYNAEKIKASEESGAWAIDAKGNKHYCGVAEDDGYYAEFKSCGSKKYGYRDERGKLHVTIAGVEKKKGAEELERRGGLEVLADDFVFYDAGGLAARYNDIPEISCIKVDGHEVLITSNLYLYQSEYTVGTIQAYKDIIALSKIEIDRIAKMLYNSGVLKAEQ